MMQRVEVELPSESLEARAWEPRELAQELRLLWLLDQVRQRRVGFNKAAELAGLPVARFLDLMAEHRLTPFDYDEEELARELA